MPSTSVNSPSSVPMVKRVIGIVLLLIGAWVTYDGATTGETVTMILGIAALIGGLCFLFIRPHRLL